MKKRIVTLVVVPLLAVSFLAAATATAGTPERFRWHISNAFIQEGTGLTQTGARAQADNGDYARISGRGKFDPSTGTASGGGVFAHTNSSGVLVGFGSWTATGVADFEFFGCGGEDLPDNFCGGVLTLEVHLNGINVTLGPGAFDGVLVVNCLIGDVPAGLEEGITIDIPGVINFDALVPAESGLTLFVSRG
jgi:hypothetical protein